MAINKVEYGDQTLMDLTEDTVTENKVLKGETFHDRSGVSRTGNVNVPVPEDITVVDEFISYNGGRVKSAQMELKPIQDLHGYDHPWVGGAGANKWDEEWRNGYYQLDTQASNYGQFVSFANAVANKNPIPVLSSTNYTMCVVSGGGGSIFFYDSNQNVISHTLFYTSPFSLTTPANCAYINFNMNASPYGATYKNDIALNYPSTVTTYSSYSNICPISGHTQAKLEQRGKNLYNKDSSDNLNNKGLSQTTGDVVNANGWIVSPYIVVKGNQQYTYTDNGITINFGIVFCYYDSGKNFISSDYLVREEVRIIQTPANAKFVRFELYNTATNYLQFELGSSATDYEPYQGKDYIINLGGTYYWLRGDVVSGKWYVVGAYRTFRWGTYTRTDILGDTKRRILATLSDAYGSYTEEVGENNISDSFEEQMGWTTDTPHFYIDSNNKTLVGFLPVSVSDDAIIQLCYKLATPIPLDLTPQQILAIIGENHFSAPLEQQEIIEIIARNIAEFNEVIDDENVSDEFTYSSEKIEDRLEDFVDKDAVEEKSATTEFETINGGLLSSLKVSLTPNQDLHGYPNPLVGGAGKNLINKDGVDTNNGYKHKYYITPSGTEHDASGDWDILEYVKVEPSTAYTISGITPLSSNGFAEYDENKQLVNAFALTTSPFTFTTTANTHYIRANRQYTTDDSIQLEEGSTATAYEPYENICPISGHTQVKINNGKNLIGLGTRLDGYAGTTYFETTLVAVGYYFATSDLPDVVTISDVGGNRAYISYYNEVPAYGVVYLSKDQSQQTVPKTFTVDKTAEYVHIQLSYGTTDVTNIQIEEGSTATPYVPYNGYQVTVNLGGTYYSGTLDVVTGVFTPDMAGVDLGDFTWTHFGAGTAHDYWRATITNPLPKRARGYNIPANILCSQYENVSGNDVYNNIHSGIIAIPSDNDFIMIYDANHISTSSSDFKTAMSGVQFVYELATPTPIQLSPTMVKALVGENHLSAPLDGQEITESKYKELFTLDEVEEIAQKIADSKIDNINTSYNTTFSSAFTEARYVKKIYGAPVLTALQIVLSGAPSITFNHQLIFSDSQTCCELIQFGSGARIGITDVAISQGSVTFTFDSPLTKAIGFRCRITNDFVS